ncbi:translation elongation factor Ts [Candidatus Dependentiae bacterium]|nr:translation elongation factor Ts [Candidatus Dependentiae bacterium]MBU4387124.1 translation elongation factor Ts [Candidatus Dependentiae bacterium]MCG2756532.1 translation elongation factor Ts [Candidatus Dependentiae bacterium]
MAEITMELIKELREKTQVGMMDCKKALIESNGDIEKAIEILRKKGAAVAQKRAGNATDNGHVESCLSKDFRKGVLLKMSCETDFSANTQDMKNFAKDVCEHILSKGCKSVENLLNEIIFNGKITIQQKLEELIAKIAESIKAEEFVLYETDNFGFVNSYIHPGANLGILIELRADKEITGANVEKLKQLTHDLCMQIAVTNPLSISSNDLDKDVIAKEQEIIKEQLLSSGKPANMVEKIMQGKLAKFYEDVCLENQVYIKNDKLKVNQLVESVSKETGLKLEIKNFTRFFVGKQ